MRRRFPAGSGASSTLRRNVDCAPKKPVWVSLEQVGELAVGGPAGGAETGTE